MSGLSERALERALERHRENCDDCGPDCDAANAIEGSFWDEVDRRIDEEKER